MSVLTLDLIKNSGPKHQQHQLRTWHPESSQSVQTSYWTSNTFDFVPFSTLPPDFRTFVSFEKKKHFACLCKSPVTLHLSTPREALPSSWINFSHDSLKAAVILAVCALFLPHFSLEVSYPQISFSTALCNSQPFLRALLWFTLLVDDVNDHYLENCQVSSWVVFACTELDWEIDIIYTVWTVFHSKWNLYFSL